MDLSSLPKIFLCYWKKGRAPCMYGGKKRDDMLRSPRDHGCYTMTESINELLANTSQTFRAFINWIHIPWKPLIWTRSKNNKYIF